MKKSEATRQRILDAATDEFAAYGIAGARVDRIASASKGNKSLLYAYFGSKEKLFVAVLNKHLDSVLDQVPFTADDLPAYAVRLFDFALQHPKHMRLLSWYGLEELRSAPEGWLINFDSKVRKIATAQRKCIVGKHLPPDFLLAAIISLAYSYSDVNAFRGAIYPRTAQRLPMVRKALTKAIARMVAA